MILTVHVPFPPLNVLTMISPVPGAFGRRHTSFREEWYSRVSRQLTPLIVNSEIKKKYTKFNGNVGKTLIGAACESLYKLMSYQ